MAKKIKKLSKEEKIELLKKEKEKLNTIETIHPINEARKNYIHQRRENIKKSIDKLEKQ